MTPADIIRAHATNQGQNPNVLATSIKKFLEQPETKVVREGDCLFLVKNQNGVGNFYILNGGNSTGYVRALRAFVVMMRSLGYQKIAMRVQDQEQSQKIARTAGVKSMNYTEVGGTEDPYLMTMEL
tara:strand:- start:17305 stop:17682 length:378 start_codon:yes stop_codon:yes gene_type:complete